MPCGYVNIMFRGADASGMWLFSYMREASASSLVLQSRAKPHASDCGMSDKSDSSRIRCI